MIKKYSGRLSWRYVPRIALALAMSALLAGCAAVGPNYVKPEPKVPDAWQVKDEVGIVPGQTDIRDWWRVFQDPMLSELIGLAGEGNLDLKIALARVEEARARVGVAAGGEMPTVSADGDVTHQRSSENDLAPGGTSATRWNAGVNAGWEIDLFGRIRRSVEAAEADYQATEEDRAAVMVSLYAQVAQTYIDIRAYQARIAAIRKNITSQQDILRLTEVRFNSGLATGLDVSQAQTVLAASRAEIPTLQISLAQSINSVALLLGRIPGALAPELRRKGEIPSPPAEVTVAVPADLLRQRPDIRLAERNLAAETARIGVATADLYPTFSLLGTLGFAATDIGMLFNGGSHLYSIGPSVTWNVFQGGRIRAQIKAADARAKQALLSYEQTVLSALNEVENLMVAYTRQGERVKALEKAVTTSNRTLALAVKLYKDGLRDFQSVLDAQRSLTDFENQLAAARGLLASNLVGLYKAMGGGWQVPRKMPDSGQKSYLRRVMKGKK